ncbi:type 1 glutamine amidotransferase [Aquibacillus albus]|uniref:GMP synthase-like glutamine amidotransferase n=1 Tax=Aquibacillus albus TaxID=1168171 RepID=A0ABS2N2X1_9BACI|nr:type 1 glutamine amidotransferase [Aquibacillus albus]MBM7572472.1 GMP synthase-like glutamine amidotransferase [Aquibacillus albus]
MRVHVIQHDPVVGLGYIEDWFINNNITYETTQIHLGESFPALESFDLIIFLGGRMGAYEEDKYPWLKEEKAFIRDVVHANKFVFGICLGCQLIADALGGKAYKHEHLELGWHPTTLNTGAMTHPLLKEIEQSLAFFEFHNDTFDLPHDACLIGENECARQGFTYGERVLAIQFHPEFNESIVSFSLENLYPSDSAGEYVQSVEEINQYNDFKRSKNWLFRVLDHFEEQYQKSREKAVTTYS